MAPRRLERESVPPPEERRLAGDRRAGRELLDVDPRTGLHLLRTHERDPSRWIRDADPHRQRLDVEALWYCQRDVPRVPELEGERDRLAEPDLVGGQLDVELGCVEPGDVGCFWCRDRGAEEVH